MENRKLIDFYLLTVSYSDMINENLNQKSYFDLFYRKNPDNAGYSISAGLDNIIEYIQNLKFNEDDIEYLRSLKKFDERFLKYLKDFKFAGDIYAIPDGTVIHPGEPCITVYANTIEAQLIETDLLNKFNHGSLIATKSRRIVNELKGKTLIEFGARRAQGGDAAIEGAKYSYIGGSIATSCYEAGKKYGLPLKGTMPHSHVMKHNTEYESFLAYARAFPDDSIFLVDTIDTLRSGIPNAIRVAKEYLIPNGHRLQGIRLDSGDLSYLSKQVRIMLDEAGLEDCIICVSNSLDEVLIKDLHEQVSPIDSFGTGENLITSRSCPVFGGVYKLVAIEENNKIIPKIKISENIEKITNPGYKKVYRFYDNNTGFALGDVIALAHEIIPEDTYTLVDERDDWKQTTLTNYTVKQLQVPIFKNGELVYNQPSLKDTREHCEQEVNTLYPEIKRINNPHKYYVDLSLELLKLKKDLLLYNKNLTTPITSNDEVVKTMRYPNA